VVYNFVKARISGHRPPSTVEILDLWLLQQVVLITPVITTTLKYPAAVGEAWMLQPPHNGASPR